MVVFDFVVAEVVFLVERAVADFHGEVRPDTSMMGGASSGRIASAISRSSALRFSSTMPFCPARSWGEVACENARSMVAEVMMTFQDPALRQDALEVAEDEVNVQAAFVRPSMMRVEKRRSSLSFWISASRMPSVMSLIAVFAHFGGESHLVADGLTDFLTKFFGDAFSDGRAASRRGWVWPMVGPLSPRPRSRHILGIWVVLPEPVSPAMMTTWLSRIAFMISSRRSLTGSSSG